MAKHFATGLALGLCLVASSALAATGEYWEITHKMEMAGLSLPARTNQVCMPQGGQTDPRNVNADKDCEVTDIKISGSKSTWKMRCMKGGEELTGIGEMSATPERGEGLIKITSRQGAMAMRYVSKRVGGACDAPALGADTK